MEAKGVFLNLDVFTLPILKFSYQNKQTRKSILLLLVVLYKVSFPVAKFHHLKNVLKAVFLVTAL